MSEVDARVAGWIAALMRDARAPLVLRRRGAQLPIRVAAELPAKGRPDGLRDDVQANPGFSFAVTEATLQVDARALAPAQLEAAHEVFDEAARDFDWIGYSHQGRFDRAAIDANPTLTLFFSSAAKGADALVSLLEAIGVPPSEVTV